VLFPGAAHEDLLAYDPRRFIRAVDDFLHAAGAPLPGNKPIELRPNGSGGSDPPDAVT
jgi:hypothetical protein